MALTVKQNAFVAAFLVHGNATQAALDAGYPLKSAASVGSENLKKPEIKKAIDEALARRAERVEVKADDVLRVLMRNLTFDPATAHDELGALLPIQDMPKEARLAVQSIEYGQFGPKVKFWSKDKALELGMRHLGLLKDRVEHSVSKSLEELVLESLKKPTGGEK